MQKDIQLPLRKIFQAFLGLLWEAGAGTMSVVALEFNWCCLQ